MGFYSPFQSMDYGFDSMFDDPLFRETIWPWNENKENPSGDHYGEAVSGDVEDYNSKCGFNSAQNVHVDVQQNKDKESQKEEQDRIEAERKLEETQKLLQEKRDELKKLELLQEQLLKKNEQKRNTLKPPRTPKVRNQYQSQLGDSKKTETQKMDDVVERENVHHTRNNQQKALNNNPEVQKVKHKQQYHDEVNMPKQRKEHHQNDRPHFSESQHHHAEHISHENEDIQPGFQKKAESKARTEQGQPQEHERLAEIKREHHQARTNNQDKRVFQTVTVVELDVPGYYPSDLKIHTVGHKIHIHGMQTCSCSENCVSRELEKVFDLPLHVDSRSLTAILDGDSHLEIHGRKFFSGTISKANVDVPLQNLGLPFNRPQMKCAIETIDSNEVHEMKNTAENKNFPQKSEEMFQDVDSHSQHKTHQPKHLEEEFTSADMNSDIFQDQGELQHTEAIEEADIQEKQVKIAELDIPGYYPSDLKILTVGHKIHVHGIQTCSCSDSCVVREFEKVYEIPEEVDSRTLRAVLDRDSHLQISGSQYFGGKVNKTHVEVPVEGLGISMNRPKAVCDNVKKPVFKTVTINSRTGQKYKPELYDADIEDEVTIEDVNEY